MLVLIASCRSYADAWGPFITLFNRFWSDCPYRKVFFSDMPDKIPEIGDFKFMPIDDRGWIQNLLDVSSMFTIFDTVMFFQEDFFLTYPVDQARIAGILEWFEKSDYDICRVYPMGYDSDIEVYPGVVQLQSGAPYRASCQASIWKRDKLIELCRRVLGAGGRRPTDFEIIGSPLIDDFRICTWNRKGHPSTWALAYQCTAISWGKWMCGAVKFCLDQGIVLNPQRQIMWSGNPEYDTPIHEEYKRAVYG